MSATTRSAGQLEEHVGTDIAGPGSSAPKGSQPAFAERRRDHELVELVEVDPLSMGRAGIEPATLGLKVPCSTN
jgi:hypothetical protein